MAPAASQAAKNNHGYQNTVGKKTKPWHNTCSNAQTSYTNWMELSRIEFIKGETAYSGQDKEVAEKIEKNANASGCSVAIVRAPVATRGALAIESLQPAA